MKKIIIFLVLIKSISSMASSDKSLLSQATENYLTIDSVEIVDLTEKYKDKATHEKLNLHVQSVAKKMNMSKLQSQLNGASATLDLIDLNLDKVINIGTKVWNVVEKGKPIQNYSSTVATALPEGTRSWTDLENWKDPETKVYGVSYKNIYGMEVVRFVYRVILVAGGDVRGIGKYIGYAAIEPVKMETAYLYKFDAVAEVMNVSNKGSHENPLAGMVITLRWDISTILKVSHDSHTFFLDGNGKIQKADSNILQ